mmetsp:Transcript_61649/g.137623  ORF Transcript_61649/g.137623 Transcript_61649/m.137623 type:complete len:411 (+) Transcript_61649:4-1236(+)
MAMELRLFAVFGPLAVIGKECHDFDAQCCHINPAVDPHYEDFKGNASHMVPEWGVVDLALPPAERWATLAAEAAPAMRTMIAHFKSFVGLLSSEIFKLMEDSEKFKKIAERVLDEMGEYGLEMRGIANATGIPSEEVLFLNMMYEIEGGCTSIVAQDENGHVFHGRNLDFGLFFGEDWRRLQWTLTEDLRPLLRNVHFVEGHVPLYSSTIFLGYVGTLTAVKKGAFSVTVNTRYDSSHWASLLAFLEGKGSGNFLSLTLRDMMVQNSSYAEALKTIQTAPLLGPAYVIVGGAKSGEGAVIERSANGIAGQRLLADVASKGVNSLVQTNWDFGKDPFFDNRRSPAEHCLTERFNTNITFPGLFSVLSARPNRNRLTTYTALMSAETGDLEAYLQFCKELECAPWMTATVMV